MFDLCIDALTHLPFGNEEIITRLQIHPELRTVAKVPR